MLSGPSGILLVDKPAGPTSRRVVDRVVRALGTRRFRVLRRWTQPDQLVRAEVQLLPDGRPLPVPERYRAQAEWVAQVLPVISR